MAHTYVWYDAVHTGRNTNTGITSENMDYLFASREFSITADLFTGQTGTFSTVDDIVLCFGKTKAAATK